MKSTFFALASLAVALPALALPVPPLPAAATPVAGDTRLAEAFGELCEKGNPGACRDLVAMTGGNCAAPAGSGCRYDSNVLVPVDNGLMVNVPNLGYSRIETVSFCLEEAGVGKYQDLQTDSQFEGFEGCMVEHT